MLQRGNECKNSVLSTPRSRQQIIVFSCFSVECGDSTPHGFHLFYPFSDSLLSLEPCFIMNEILETSIAFWRSAALFTALRLDLFEKLGERFYHPVKIADMTNTGYEFIIRLLRALTAMKLLEQNEKGYRCSKKSLESLIPGRQSSLSHFCRVMGEDFQRGIWIKPEQLASGGTISFPPPVKETAGYTTLFTMAMHNLALQGEASALVDSLTVPESGVLLDLGCGSGAYSAALLKRYLGWKAVLVDKPDVLNTTRRIVAEHELSERVELRPGDFFNLEFESDFDLALLSDVMYMGVEKCRALISLTRRALKEGGQIAIRGYFIDSQNPVLFAALFDINLMVNNPGYSNPLISNVQHWVKDAGFSQIASKRLTELSHLITARRGKFKD